MKKTIVILVGLLLLLLSNCYAIETKNEQTAITLELTTKDIDNNDFTPSTIKYTVVDTNTGEEMVSSTAIAPTSSVTDITIPASSNTIIDDSLSYEERLFSFEVYFGSDVIYSGDYVYRLRNLVRIPL